MADYARTALGINLFTRTVVAGLPVSGSIVVVLFFVFSCFTQYHCDCRLHQRWQLLEWCFYFLVYHLTFTSLLLNSSPHKPTVFPPSQAVGAILPPPRCMR